MVRSAFVTAALILGMTSGAGAQQMTTLKIMDNQGFETPMVAYTIDVPANWSARGEVLWIKPCSSSDVFELVVDISAPDGRTGFRVQPGHKIIWNDIVVRGFDPQIAQMMQAQTLAERTRLENEVRGSNCHVTQITSADQLFRGAVQRPADMRITATAPNSQMRQQYQNLFRSAPGMKVFFDANEIQMSYTLNSQPVEETLLFSWYMFQLEPLDPNFGTFMQTTTIEPLRSVRVAPERRSQDQAIVQRIVSSFRINPGWQARMDDFYKRRAAQAQAAHQQRREDNELAWQQHQTSVAIRDLRNEINHLQFLDALTQ